MLAILLASSVSAINIVNSIWDQCGFSNRNTADAGCGPSLNCVFENNWYSQCKPSQSALSQYQWQSCSTLNAVPPGFNTYNTVLQCLGSWKQWVYIAQEYGTCGSSSANGLACVKDTRNLQCKQVTAQVLGVSGSKYICLRPTAPIAKRLVFRYVYSLNRAL